MTDAIGCTATGSTMVYIVEPVPLTSWALWFGVGLMAVFIIFRFRRVS
ncbi:MAG: hypothetical protein K0B08_09815 [Bacteroidales bacterium]|nr:hypothetical protein [Bacteroidales bacterium]